MYVLRLLVCNTRVKNNPSPLSALTNLHNAGNAILNAGREVRSPRSYSHCSTHAYPRFAWAHASLNASNSSFVFNWQSSNAYESPPRPYSRR